MGQKLFIQNKAGEAGREAAIGELLTSGTFGLYETDEDGNPVRLIKQY